MDWLGHFMTFASGHESFAIYLINMPFSSTLFASPMARQYNSHGRQLTYLATYLDVEMYYVLRLFHRYVVHRAQHANASILFSFVLFAYSFLKFVCLDWSFYFWQHQGGNDTPFPPMVCGCYLSDFPGFCRLLFKAPSFFFFFLD